MGYQSPMRYRLVIGNKNISSWSLRPWLAMRQAGIPLEEIKIALRQPSTQANILNHSPSGRVPALLVGDFAIWESLAILEYLAEAHPEARLWPAPQPARALARAVSAEMLRGLYRAQGALPHGSGCAIAHGFAAGTGCLGGAAHPGCGVTAAAGMAVRARFCSAPSRPPTPCMHSTFPI
jgi:hypothetical protein